LYNRNSAKAIPLLLENKTDLVGLAKNRNWKNGCWIAFFTINRYKHANVQAVILVPTRELGHQIFY
jgi:ATP-dependent RNA helicase DeaD